MLLEQKFVGNIKGQFLIEAYQRGYRWADDEIIHLLEDISEVRDGQFYCLQPVVVKQVGVGSKGEAIYELIDGQQRLTTLFLIMKYLNQFIDLNYSIEYVTRKSENGNVGSKELLDTIETRNLDSDSTNIDELFIKNAYKIIKGWFNDDKKTQKKFASKLEEYVSVIWYEVDPDENSTDIFTRLNIGKINLTNAELVKALFLSKGGNIDEKKQHEIALEWDRMEKELHNKKFWAFITNEKEENYPIRMEVLFDIIEKKPSKEDDFFTFNSFYKKFKNSSNKYETWETIVRYYQQLQEWYKNFDLFHQIGFLIAQGENIKDLLDKALNDSNPMLKSAFRDEIIKLIRKKMVFVKVNEKQQEEEIDYADLNYESHSSFIQTLLLLFNVETIRQKGDEDNRFPFERYKNQGTWSLEHIHAQNSESLKSNDEWREWLTSHKKSLETLIEEQKAAGTDVSEKEKVISEIDNVITNINTKNYRGSIRDEFNAVAPKVTSFLSDGDDYTQMHSLSNMALLTVGENAALNNSTFDVKRTKIIEMDKNGDYIPLCTRNVFMKYYSGSDTKLHFWSDSDRKCYIKAINKVLYDNDIDNNNKQGNEILPRLIKSKIRYGSN